jgi:hypothetical protein
VTAMASDPTHWRVPALAFLAALYLRGHPADDIPARDLAELRRWHDTDPTTYHRAAGTTPPDCPYCPLNPKE